jgi:tetratricopeptide (TPR) repeat protein
VWLAKRERLLSFAILWYLGNLVLESSVYPLDIIFEHRNYLPSILLCLLGTTAVFRLVKGKRQSMILLCAIVVLFSFWTFKRNSIWSDKILFYEDALNKSPSNVRVNMDLAEALIGKGRFDEGVQYYRMAMVLSEEKRNSGEVLQPYHYDSIFHLATRLAEKKRYSEASILFERVVQLYPHDANYHNNYAFVLEKLGYLDKAIYHYSQALRYNPGFNHARQGLEWTKKRKAALSR